MGVALLRQSVDQRSGGTGMWITAQESAAGPHPKPPAPCLYYRQQRFTGLPHTKAGQITCCGGVTQWRSTCDVA
jgi:hypothetical protein